MSLDIATLADDGTPEHAIPLSVDLHHELMVGANKLGLSELLRLGDYYSDVEFLPSELPELSVQVEALRLKASSDNLRKTLKEFEKLINNAVLNRKVLHAIAD
jgi:hypothetical protein